MKRKLTIQIRVPDDHVKPVFFTPSGYAELAQSRFMRFFKKQPLYKFLKPFLASNDAIDMRQGVYGEWLITFEVITEDMGDDDLVLMVMKYPCELKATA